MRVHLNVNDLTDRTRRLTLIADNFPEERLLSLMQKAIETKGSIAVEAEGEKLTWLPKDAQPEGQ